MTDYRYVDATEEHFATFRAEVEHMWAALGLGANMRLLVEFGGIDDEKINANCGENTKQRNVRIRFNRRQPESYLTDAALREHACHEVAHAFLCPFGTLAWDRFVDEDTLDAAEHEVVNRLVALFGRLVK